jgi:hypothetical protein
MYRGVKANRQHGGRKQHSDFQIRDSNRGSARKGLRGWLGRGHRPQQSRTRSTRLSARGTILGFVETDEAFSSGGRRSKIAATNWPVALNSCSCKTHQPYHIWPNFLNLKLVAFCSSLLGSHLERRPILDYGSVLACKDLGHLFKEFRWLRTLKTRSETVGVSCGAGNAAGSLNAYRMNC